MQTYLELLQKVKKEGASRTDRTGVGTWSIFGPQIEIDLQKGFPLLTTKKLHFKSIVHELLWFLKGDTNIRYLQENGVRIWDEWADTNGDLGPIYGKQWIAWSGPDGPINQIKNVINEIRSNPDSRRLIVMAWNPGEIPFMKLAPCHMAFQLYVDDGMLSCKMFQRSGDIFLGVPYNIASYSLLTHLIAHVTGLTVGKFIHTFGDLHLYKNHIEQATLQLMREPKALPTVKINPSKKDIFDIKYEDIHLENYNAHSTIKAAVAV